MGSSQPKFNTIYQRLFQGYTPSQISPEEDADSFYSNLLSLEVNRVFLQGQLDRLPKEHCLGGLKPALNSLFRTFLHYASDPHNYDPNNCAHALETLCILTRTLLAKNLTGWEIMELLAGGTKDSDAVFMSLTSLVDSYLSDDTIPAITKFGE